LNSVCRNLSLVGRVASPRGACNTLDRYSPPITRIPTAYLYSSLLTLYSLV
jgi:hypothetical protein